MNILEAIYKRRKEVEAERAEALKRLAGDQAAWKEALRKRLDEEYDLQFPDEHFASWHAHPNAKSPSIYDIIVPLDDNGARVSLRGFGRHPIRNLNYPLSFVAYRYSGDEEALRTDNFIDAYAYALVDDSLERADISEQAVP
jgi:hypothetical protein